MSDEKFCLASCDHCGLHIEFPAQGVGRRVACPQCAGETILVEDLSLASGRVEEISAAELKAALAGTVARHRVSLFYQAGLLVVAIFMLFLPLAYLAFATFAGYCIYWYGDHARVLFSNPSRGVFVLILKLLLYLGPLVGGGVAVFFMFKPILARRPKRAEPIALKPT